MSFFSAFSMLNCVRTASSAGLDGMRGSMYKYLPFDVGDITSLYGQLLAHILQQVYKQGIYPKQWAEAYMTFIHKGKVTTQCEDFRGITVSPNLYRAYASWLN